MRISPAWQRLSSHAARLCEAAIPDLVAADPARANDFAMRVGPLYANFARQRFDREARDALFALATDADVPVALKALYAGERVNVSEHRPAMHTALRSDLGDSSSSAAAHAQAVLARTRMAAMISALEASDVTDIVNVGIGGSDLGPRLAVDALGEFGTGRFRVHFLNNADAHPIDRLLPTLDPARTAVVLVSKSFGTQETLLNAGILRPWLGDDSRLYAVTANVAKAQSLGIDGDRILPMWDWVGGRYSLWSSVGFAVALAIGMSRFEQLLAGAAEMDAHVRSAPPAVNLACWHALAVVWNRNGLGYDTHAVLPYDERLALLPAYLQQLVMESLGKSVRTDGSDVEVATTPVLWGGPGTSSQHSFFQALHQGTDTVPCDFVGVVRPAHAHAESQRALFANLLAQAEAMANGEPAGDQQKRYPGSRPSTMFLLDELTPRSLGTLLAMYEHSVYVQATLWGINAFDQWGVELGKRLADGLLPALADPGVEVGDPITRELLAQIHDIAR